MIKPAPIVLFVYNRPEHTKRTLDALAANHLAAESELFIYIDGIKPGSASKDIQNNQQVKTIANAENRFKQLAVIESPDNKGLARSIIEGVTNTLELFDRVIILEDDLLTSPHFLNFLNDALELYQHDDKVACISGYIYPVQETLPETFFLKGADCWGWATWKRAWKIFEQDGKKLLEQLSKPNILHDFNFFDSYPYLKMLEDQIAGKNSSWAIRWYASAYLHGKLCLYPSQSFVHNIGFDGTGTHSGKRNFWQGEGMTGKLHLARIKTEEDRNAKMTIANYFKMIRKKSLVGHVKNLVNGMLRKFS